MLVRRRRALASALVTAVAVTSRASRSWGRTSTAPGSTRIVGTGQITRPGNLALTGLGNPVLYVPLTVMAAAALALWAIVGDERRGFAAALVSAMLVAPFTLMYQASILLVAVRPALAVAPRATRVLALVANPAVLVAFIGLGGRGPGEPGPVPAARSAIDAVTAGVRQLSPAGVLALVGIAIGATILVLGLGSWPGTYYTLDPGRLDRGRPRRPDRVARPRDPATVSTGRRAG